MAITLWRPKVFSPSRMDSDDWSDFVFPMDDMISAMEWLNLWSKRW